MLKSILLASAIALAVVGNASAAEKPWTDEEQAAGIRKLEFVRYAFAGKQQTIQLLYALNPDCSEVDGWVFEITKQPEHGVANVEPSSFFPIYPKDNPRYTLCCGALGSKWHIAADADDLNLRPLSGAQRKWRAALTACETIDPKSGHACRCADRGILFDKSFASPRVDCRWCWSFITVSSHAQIECRAGRHSRQEGRASRCRALSAASWLHSMISAQAVCSGLPQKNSEGLGSPASW